MCGQVVAGRVIKYVGHQERCFIIWLIQVDREHGVPNLIETVQTYVIDAYPQGGLHLALRVKSTFIGLLIPSGRGRGTFVTPARSSEEQFAKAKAEVRYLTYTLSPGRIEGSFTRLRPFFGLLMCAYIVNFP